MSGAGGPAAGGLRLDELARELPMAVTLVGEASTRVSGVQHDSRQVRPGDLFVARAGAREHGDRFVADAVARGAAAVLCGPAAPEADRWVVPTLVVDDPAAALAHAASAVYGHPSFSLDVVGITGTNGKTTTAHLVRVAVDGAIGRPSCGVLGTIGHGFGDWSAGTSLTTPEADEIARVMAEMKARGATHAAMEVSSHALALGRVRAVHFRVAALTNVTQDHLDFHGSMEAYRAAKERLFTELAPASAVLNVRDPAGRALAARLSGAQPAPSLRVPVIRVSSDLDSDADVRPLSSRADARGIRADVATPAGRVVLDSRLAGAHNLENLLLALGIAHALELDLARAADALSNADAPPGRLERCDRPGDDVAVLVDYAHTPDALARVLEALRSGATGRLWCVFGCGGDRDPTKRGPMGEIVARVADVAIVTNDNPRTEDPRAIADAVAAGARAAGREPVVELDRRRAIQLAVGSAAAGDIVLVAGKGHEDYQVVGHVKYPFDDRIESRRALDARNASHQGARPPAPSGSGEGEAE